MNTDPNNPQPTPAELAEYDQALAEINTTINQLVHAYRHTATQYGPPQTLIGLAESLETSEQQPGATAHYLAAAIKRIADLEDAIREAIAVVKHNDSPTANEQ